VVDQQIDALDATWDAQTHTVEGVRTYWDGRVHARAEFLKGLQALNPPDEAAELHGTVLDLFARLTAAEEALAVRVASFETVTESEQWWDTQEGQAAHAIDEEVTAICHVVQARFDATIEREVFSAVPWIPTEMRETVRIDLNCQ